MRRLSGLLAGCSLLGVTILGAPATAQSQSAAAPPRLDVVGIQLGAKAADVKTVLARRGHVASTLNPMEGNVQLNGHPELRFLSYIYSVGGPQNESVAAYFTGPPNDGSAWMVARSTSYVKGPQQAPSVEATITDLQNRFGPASFDSARYSPVPGSRRLMWVWRVDGRKVSSPRSDPQDPCAFVARQLSQSGIAVGRISNPPNAAATYNQAIFDSANRGGCDVIYEVNLISTNGVVTTIRATAANLKSAQASYERTRTLSDQLTARKREEALRGANAVRPDL